MTNHAPALRLTRSLVVAGAALLVAGAPARATLLWIEGEKPASSTMNRHPWWYDQVKRSQLSGHDLISNWHQTRAGLAEYRFEVPSDGAYDFWVRANPVKSQLSYKLNRNRWVDIDLTRNVVDQVNIAADGAIDLRFIAWIKVGKVTLQKGENTIYFMMDSKDHNHGYLDCFVLTDEPFQPRGALKPGEKAAPANTEKDYLAFTPKPDPFTAESAIDLRALNEPVAGAGGFITAKGGHFVHSQTGQPVRFWAVNRAPGNKDREAVRREARFLAKCGVNLVRIHGGYFDEKGELKMNEVREAIDLVDALKAEGIYSHFSIYAPVWLHPQAGTPWLQGYDGHKNTFAVLNFNKDFQERYRSWWKALLLTPNPRTGQRLIDDPAVAGVELINEDSYLFWTFNADAVPDTQLRILETQFGDWLKRRYGSLDATQARWGHVKTPRDAPGEGRLGFRHLWNMSHERTARDKDTARFLVESQRAFYDETYRFIRDLGFKGLITTSNWITASPEVLGPLEKYTYMAGDFIDRHGYFTCDLKGDSAEWSIRNGHTYRDRSALRFDPEEPGKPRQFSHPVMDPKYGGKPSMLSETTFNRPNRYRSEAPLFYAAYGALQDSDTIAHLALDTTEWSVKPGYFMQPWTLASPAMIGQFPAAALIYRKGLVATGDVLAELNLALQDLYDLQGTPLPPEAGLEEPRLKDVAVGGTLGAGKLIDPLIHFAGRTNVNFTETGGTSTLRDLAGLVDHDKRTVRSSTGQLLLDYGRGILSIDAPQAQGADGNLKAAGKTELKDLTVESTLDLGQVVAVSLDRQPLATSRRILLQVMSEEMASEFRTEPAGTGMKRITSIGENPWLFRELSGVVKFKRPDAAQLKVTALDFNGYPEKQVGSAEQIKLRPGTLYYLIAP